MEAENENNKKDYILGICGMSAVAIFTILGVIIKNMFFMR